MSVHTPGPWRTDDRPGCREIRANKAGIHKQGQWRTLVAVTSGIHDDVEDSANARLIVAAPDLLAVVQDFRQKLATYVHVYQGDKELRRQLRDCDAVIALVATGRRA